ncbi:MAG: hypothetical protein ACOY81_04685 [Bacillota bacterium]
MLNLKFNQLLEMRRQMAQFFSAESLNQGYLLYGKKAVSEVGQAPHGALQARVADRPRSRKNTHEVFIQPDRLEFSSCTCQQPFCPHLAALLFAVLGQYMDAAECYHWLVNGPGRGSSSAAAAPGDNGGSNQALVGGDRAAATQQPSVIGKLRPADEPALWQSAWQELWFGGRRPRFSWQRLLAELPGLSERGRLYWQKVQELSSDWPGQYRVNFNLGALIYLAIQLEEIFSELTSHLPLPPGRVGRRPTGSGHLPVSRPEDLRPYFYSAQRFCGEVFRQIEQLITAVAKSRRVDADALLRACPSLWGELLPLVSRQVLLRTGDDVPPLLNWRHLYWMVSIAVLTEPADLERELVRLKRLGKERPEWLNNQEYILLLGHITYLRYGLAEAARVWDGLEAQYLLWPYVYGVVETGDWPLLLEWLMYMSRWLGELARLDPRMVEQEELLEDIHVCLGFWDRLLQQDRREQVQHAYQAFLQQMLPCASVLLPLVQYYARQKQRQQLGDLFLMLENIVFNEAPDIQTSRELHREFQRLSGTEQLPFYHQKVEALLAKRNREEYREAVKILGQMRQLYAKLGQFEEWQRYCERLMDKYSRLRVFKEMLRQERVI